MGAPSNQDLLLRLLNGEDNWVERKSFTNRRGWLETAIAFANSAPIGSPTVLFIGVKNDGRPEGGKENLEETQKSFSRVLSQAYPPIYYDSRIVTKDDKEFLAIVIPRSPDRPHFAGHSYVRVGSETKKASNEQFAELIAQRNSKSREILNWKGKLITLAYPGPPSTTRRSSRIQRRYPRTVVDCNQFFVTLEGGTVRESISLRWVEISFDQSENRLRLEILSS